MDTVTRRRFLLASGVAGAGALALGAASITPRVLAGHAAADPLPDDANVLVLLTLYGGNDGLSTVIPYADPAYHDARPELAYDEGEVHVLGDGLGLNPALTGLAGLWQRKQLAIVRGVGYPDPDQSHFRSMDIWQSASPSTPVNTGWIGRWLDAGGDDPVRALNIGTVPAPAAVGARCVAAAIDPNGHGQLPAAFTSAVTALGTPQRGDAAELALARTAYRDERIVARTFGPVFAGTSAPGAAAAGDPTGDSGQAANALGAQLDFVGRCVRAGVPTRVYLVSLGGFDTHAEEKSTQQGLLAALDSAVTGFLSSMANDPRGKRVVLLAYSEFGRRVAANASDGTDHGTAAPLLVAGVPVHGGFYGQQPSLTDLVDGNLRSTVDFRAVYGEMLSGVLATDPSRVLDSVPAPLGLLG